MSSLTRTVHGRFSIADAHTLQEIRDAKENGTLSRLVLPVEEMFSMYPAFRMKKDEDRFLRNGNHIPLSFTEPDTTPENDALYRAFLSDGRFAALYRYRADTGAFSAEKMFLPENS